MTTGGEATAPEDGEVAGRERRSADSANGLRNSAALALTKTGDAVVDPKLILAWLMGALGAPGWMIGLLAPLREAGALVPQTLLAPAVEASRVARWWWIAGSVGQAVAAAGMGAAAIWAPSDTAPWLIMAALTLFALARNLASTAYKRVLGASVEEGARGTTSGRAKSASSLMRFVLAGLIAAGFLIPSPDLVGVLLMIAACAWALASFVMAPLDETPRGGTDADARRRGYWRQFGALRQDRELQCLLAVRGLLTVTALAPPYLASLSGADGLSISLDALGPLLLVSAAASTLSAAPWGRRADRSSGGTLRLAAWLSAGILATSAAIAAVNDGRAPLLAVGVLLFALTIAYEGVRAGRSTHLVDMAPAGARAEYGAVANTVIGGVLLVAGGLGAVAQHWRPGGALLLFALFAAVAALVAGGLREGASKQDDAA